MAITIQNPLTGSDNTFKELNGSVTAQHVYLIGGSLTYGGGGGGGTTGSESYNFVDSGGTWIVEPEFRNIIISGVPQVNISGGIHIGSVSANVDSIYIQSGNNINGSMSLLPGTSIHKSGASIKLGDSGGWMLIAGFDNTGEFVVPLKTDTEGCLKICIDSTIDTSVVNWSAGSLSVYTSGDQYFVGSVYQGTSPWIVSGTSTIAGSVYTTGSVNIATNLTQIGSFTSMALGSVAITNIGSVKQFTNPWIVSGTSTIAGSAYVTGSINIATSLTQIGSFTTMAIGSSHVTQSTSPWVISGTSTVAGSVYAIGSINIATSVASIGSFSQQGVVLNNEIKQYSFVTGSITSNGSTNVIANPGTGSHTFMKFFSITNFATADANVVFHKSGGNIEAYRFNTLPAYGGQDVANFPGLGLNMGSDGVNITVTGATPKIGYTLMYEDVGI